MWVVQQDQKGGVLGYQNYNKVSNDKWIADVKSKIQCPSSFKMTGWRSKSKQVQSYMYLPNQPTTSTQSSTYNVRDNSSYQSYNVTGNTTTTTDNNSMSVVPYAETVAWVEHSYKCLNTQQLAQQTPNSLESLETLCKKGQSKSCIRLSYKIEKSDPERSDFLLNMICKKDGDEVQPYACLLKANNYILSKNDRESAIPYYKKSCLLRKNYDSKSTSYHYSTLACGFYGASTHKKKFLEIGTELLEEGCIGKKDKGSCYDLACQYSVYGDINQSIKALKRSFKYGYQNWNHLENDPDLENLRNSKEFKIFKNENSSRSTASE
jgi:hypothetical protein